MSDGTISLVSMVIPLYNHAKYVRAAIDSIIQQDYPHIELLVIDDGSTDDSAEVARALTAECEARFVRFELRSRPNRGLSATINEGIEWSRGTYFAVLASDDVLLPNKTSRLIAEIENEPRVAGVFSGYQLIDDSGAPVGEVRSIDALVSFEDMLYGERTFAAASQLLRLELLKEVGGYPPNLYIEDWYMWLTLTKRGYSLKTIAEPLIQYRQHPTNISKDAARMFEGRRAVLSHFQNEKGVNIAMAKVCLLAAIDSTWVSKRQSVRFVASSVRSYPGIVFTRRFAYALARLGVPKGLSSILTRSARP